jgi:hypothetical protein
MPTVVLTLGRLPKALDIARSFAALGWRVVVAEPMRRHLAGASRAVARSVALPSPATDPRAYREALAAVAAEERAELVVPVSEEVLHVAHLRAPVFAPAGERVVELHDKHRFANLARGLGLDAPETHRLGTREAAELAAREDVIAKPAHSSGGRGLRIVRRGGALPILDAPHAVQRFVRGDVLSTCTVARAGAALGTAVYRGLVFDGSVAVCFERVEEPAVADWVARFVAATAYEGFVSFDFIKDESGRPWAIECNPRTTSGLHFFETADIAPAILEGRAPRFRRERVLQQFWSVLTAATARTFRRGYYPLLGRALSTRDVTWAARDPLPLLTMPWTAWPILSAARREKLSFGEVATRDLDWRDEARLTAA